MSTSRKGDAPSGAAPAFLCDHMLGSLARWLRFLGYDTLYPGPAGDDDILRLAREEGRIIVTRDRGLAARAGPGAILLSSLVLDEQILQLRGAAGLDLDGPGRMMRCPKCNSALTATTKEEVEKLARGGSASGQAIPENILGRHSEFWRCPGCGQVYWHGSHYDRIIGKIGELEKGSRQ